MDREVLDKTLLPAATRTVATNTDQVDVGHLAELLILLNITAATGTLDVKLQTTQKDQPAESDWYDLGVAFPQQSAAGKAVLKTTNFGHYVRAVATPGGATPSHTYSILLTGKT